MESLENQLKKEKASDRFTVLAFVLPRLGSNQ